MSDQFGTAHIAPTLTAKWNEVLPNKKPRTISEIAIDKVDRLTAHVEQLTVVMNDLHLRIKELESYDVEPKPIPKSVQRRMAIQKGESSGKDDRVSGSKD